MNDNAMQGIISVLGEAHLLDIYFNGFEKTLSILLTDKEVLKVLDSSKVFDIHSNIEGVKSDIHNITKKLLIIASMMSQQESQESKKNVDEEDQESQDVPPVSANLKIKNKIIEPTSQQASNNEKNIWIENVLQYFYERCENPPREEDEQHE